MKITKLKITVLTVLLAASGNLSAEGRSFIGLGAGLMTDLGGLGSTIAVDGLSSGTAEYPALSGASMGSGCDQAPDPAACQRGVSGRSQQVIVPENKLITYERATAGLIDAKTSGSMTGGVLSGFYEYEWSNHFFARGGLNYIRKIMGGKTRSSVAGIEWLDITWDYKMLFAPIHLGIKVGDRDGAQMYGALGLLYFDGSFSVGGKNIGDIPAYIMKMNIGTQTSLDPVTNDLEGGALMYEASVFRGHGMGFAALVGVENRLENGDKIFLEVNHVTAGSQGKALAQDTGNRRHMSTHPTYPVIMNGTYFSAGYKVEL